MQFFKFIAAAALCAVALPVAGQIVPPDENEPVRVINGRGEFAKKLHGVSIPTGKGWKTVTDRERHLQLAIPDRWKVNTAREGNVVLRATPPGTEKNPTAILMVMLAVPRDTDPLEIDQALADGYAEGLAGDPALKRVQFRPTDAGLVVSRGMKFALAGGTMVYRKQESFQQQQMLYVSEDRVVTIQFAAKEQEFAKHADDVARIFASYQSLAALKTGLDSENP